MIDDARQKIYPKTIKALIEHGVRDFSNTTIKRKRYDSVNMNNCDFSNTKLKNVIFSFCDCRGTTFCGATLQNVDFVGCDLRGANLTYIEAKNVDFSGRLGRTNFAFSKLINSSIFQYKHLDKDDNYIDVRGAQWKFGNNNIKIQPSSRMIMDEGADFFYTHCPQEGEFEGWKILYNYFHGFVIAHLMIPEDANRSSGCGTMCRCDKAKILDMYSLPARKSIECFDNYPGAGSHQIVEHYKSGGMFYATRWNTSRWHECTHAIHFFMSETEAIAYIKKHWHDRIFAQLIKNKEI